MWEVFSPASGNTWAFVNTKGEAIYLCASMQAGDYCPASSGYYVKQNGRLTLKRFDTMEQARRYCDFNNMASDYSTFTCFYYQASPSEQAQWERSFTDRFR